LDERGALVLFNDDPRSEVSIRRKMWGLYELIKASTDGGKVRRSALMGLAAESPARAALYVPDNGQAFTLAGRSNLKGEAQLPENGLQYGQVQSDFYTGDRLPPEWIRRAAGHFPSLNGLVLDSLAALAVNTGATEFLEKSELWVGFFEPTRRVLAENLSRVTLHGNIVVSSPGRIVVDSTARLENVILIAPNVHIGDGFTGSLQIIASDSVRIGKNVRLKYPSGIVVPQGAAESFIGIAEGGEVNGYAIFRSAAPPPDDKRTPQYLQHEQSRVRGLVWVDGIAQVHGGVTGSLYVSRANYYTPQGYYMNLLYNATIYRSEAMAFPLWMESDYQRKTAKWLD
jgi:hypothetical protein